MRDKIALLDFLRSNRFILYVAIFTVIFLSPNTFYVFHSLSIFSSPWREIASGGVSFIVAASIMIYTLRKNVKMARNYSIFEMIISTYYYVTMVGWDWALIPAIGFTIVLPLSVYHYTKEIDVDIRIDGKDMEQWLEEHHNKRPTDYINKKQ